MVGGLITVTFLSGCVTRGTTEAGGELTNATGHVVDATTDLTSPERPHDRMQLTQEQRLRGFARDNFENLIQDIARGQGEYLTSFTTLPDVPVQRHEALSRLVQEGYPVLSSGKEKLREQAEALIREFQRLSTRLD